MSLDSPPKNKKNKVHELLDLYSNHKKQQQFTQAQPVEKHFSSDFERKSLQKKSLQKKTNNNMSLKIFLQNFQTESA